MENKFGWAFVGCGAIANVVAKDLEKSGRHAIVSVFSRTQSRAEEFAIKRNAKAYSSLADAVNDPAVQAVYIATPHSAHYKNILAALDCGKPILCEKSFTINARQAKAVCELAEKKNVFLAEAMWTRFNPLIIQLRELVASGKLGKILSISASFCVPLAVSKPFVSPRVYKKEYGGGALLDLGVYPISFCQMLLGSPDSVGVVGKTRDGIDIDNALTLDYSTAKCALWASLTRLRSYTAKIVCENGAVTLPMFYRPSKMIVKLKGERAVVSRTKSSYVYEFDGVEKCVRAGKIQAEQIPHCDTIAVCEIMDDIRAQLDSKYSDELENL
ncbi:MAG: Gfo/Idh/MocA family oxidoreductase [Clostridia bacterium]